VEVYVPKKDKKSHDFHVDELVNLLLQKSLSELKADVLVLLVHIIGVGSVLSSVHKYKSLYPTFHASSMENRHKQGHTV